MSGAEIPVAMAALEAGTAAAPAVAAGTTAALGTAAAGAGAAGAGALGAGSAGAGLLGAEAAGTGAGMLAAAPEVSGAMAYTTPSIFPAAGGELSGTLAGTDLAYGSPTALANAPSVAPPTMMEQLGGYAKQGSKAASTYGTVSGAMGGNQPQRPPPQGRPVFQGEAPPIAQQQMQPQQNQYALALLEQQKRARGMLG
jgi:hypothetical protein